MNYNAHIDNKQPSTKRGGTMSDERKKEILEEFAEAFKKMDDFEKGRFLGRAEGMADAKERMEENKEDC